MWISPQPDTDLYTKKKRWDWLICRLCVHVNQICYYHHHHRSPACRGLPVDRIELELAWISIVLHVLNPIRKYKLPSTKQTFWGDIHLVKFVRHLSIWPLLICSLNKLDVFHVLRNINILTIGTYMYLLISRYFLFRK